MIEPSTRAQLVSDVSIYEPVNADVFQNFVAKTLLPHLMPFDGKNPHSVVAVVRSVHSDHRKACNRLAEVRRRGGSTQVSFYEQENGH